MEQALIYVACWKYRFRTRNLRGKYTYTHGDKSFGEREKQLKEASAEAVARLDKLAQDHPLKEQADVVNAAKPLYVFVAPEWLLSFTRESGAQGGVEQLYYGRKQRDEYHRSVEEISRARSHADVLTVTGSMLWVEERTEQALTAVKQASDTYEKKKLDKYKAVPNKGQELLAERGKLAEVSASATHLGYNEALVGFNGTVRKSVQKSANAGDFDQGGIKLVPGLGAGTFTLTVGGKPLKVGVAICYDSKRVHSYGKSTNLFILVSQTISTGTIPDQSIRTGGLIVHSDGEEGALVTRAPDWKKADDSNILMENDEGGKFLVARALVDLS